MLQNLSSAAVMIGALRANMDIIVGMNSSLDTDHLASPEASQSSTLFSKIGKISALFAYEGNMVF